MIWIVFAIWLSPPAPLTYEQWKAMAPEEWHIRVLHDQRAKWDAEDAIFDEDLNGPFYEIRR